MELLLLQLLNAVVYTSLLVLMTLGLSLIFGLGGVVNFAHAALFALGAYIGVTLLDVGVSYWLVLVLAPLAVGGIGLVADRVVVRHIRGRPHLETLLLAFGLGVALLGAIVLIWGGNPRTLRPPGVLSGTVPVLGVTFPVYRLVMVLIAGALTAAMLYVIYGTKLGLRIRAINDDPDMAQALGINSDATLASVFAVGSALAGAAGLLNAPILTLSPGMGDSLMIEGFIAVILGGAGNAKGAIVAAGVVGFVRTLAGGYAPEFGSLVLLTIVAVVLLLRPQGLMVREHFA